MTELPAGWAEATVQEIATEVRSGFASGRHNSTGAGIPHLRPMNVSRLGEIDLSEVKYVDPATNDRRLRPGDVLFNNTNSPALVGKTALFSKAGEFGFSNHMTRLRTRPGIDPAFIAIQLHYLWISGQLAHLINNHVNQASISSGVLVERVSLRLAPLAEQERIVAAIEEQFSRLDAGVTLLEQSLRRLKKMRAAVLQSAVTSSEGFGTTLLPLADLVAPGRKIAYGVLVPGKNIEGGVPFVRVGDLGHRTVNPSTLNHIAAQVAARYPRTRLEGAEVLLSLVGTIGRTAVVPAELSGANVARALAVIPVKDGVDPHYVAAVLSTDRATHELTALSHEVARKTLNLEDVRKFAIQLPSYDVQLQIVSEIKSAEDWIDRVQEVVNRAIERSRRLRAAILSAAFSGQLVPQDSADQSGSVVLERIKSTRESSSGKLQTSARNPRAAMGRRLNGSE